MDAVLDLASWVLLVSGGIFCVTGSLGLVRMPDFFTRLHGAAVLDSLGAALVLLGLVLQAESALAAVKIGLTLAFMLITGPAAVHALSRAALGGGINPLPDHPDDAPEEEEPPSAS